MPNLGYKYIMNEPFVNGTSDMYRSSHDVNSYKIEFKSEGLEGIAKKDQDRMKDEIYTRLKEDPDQKSLKPVIKNFTLYSGRQVLGEFKRVFTTEASNYVFDVNCSLKLLEAGDIKSLIKLD
jgi:hypothetical protein